MNCPHCKQPSLVAATLANGLAVYQCTDCGGHWLSSTTYLEWLGSQPTPTPADLTIDEEIPLPTTTEPLRLCAECGWALTRFKVLPNTTFRLDRCARCNGVWFDKSEWEVAVERGLADKVNQLFTEPWQTRVRQEENRRILDQVYRDRLGDEDYARLREIREWLTTHPHHAMMLAFLQADDPYKL